MSINNASLTLVDLLCWRSTCQPNQIAYNFLVDGEGQENRIVYGELDQRARAIGARLQSIGGVGQRALLLYPPGLDYIASFFGCLYAGVIAVPSYPLRQSRRQGKLFRLHSITEDCDPGIVLCASSALSSLKTAAAEVPRLNSAQWVATDCVADDMARDWKKPDINPDTLAFLQYTSGSTAAPKGVMVSHGNLLHNQRLIQTCFDQRENSVVVGWLPLYHDMGLIGNVLHPLYLGAPAILMSPTAFLQKPMRWLQAISKYRATTSGGPNFAYDLCVRRFSHEECETLDLSGWKTAFNGAEPIRQDTVERFADRFQAYGFRREAFSPCYGLAEATLLVSGGSGKGSSSAHAVHAPSLEQNQVVDSLDGSENSKTIASCGQIAQDQRLVIVDPETLTRCPDDRVGEIWLAGPSVAQGYWNRLEETAQIFRACLKESGEGPFLRTGDLGFVREGQLFVTARLKDLIIIRGRNLYPQDLELTVERSHNSLRPGCGAVFSIEVDDEEQLIIVQELESRHQPDITGVIAVIRHAVAEDYQVQVHAVVLIKPGTLPKTSSGKIQRRECRNRFLTGTLAVAGEWRAVASEANYLEPLGPEGELPDEIARIEFWLVSQLAAKLKLNAHEIDVNHPIINYGIDSITAVELAHAIESCLGVMISLVDFFHDLTISQIAAMATAPLATLETLQVAASSESDEDFLEHDLSYGQMALWLLNQLAPDSAAYNLTRAVRIKAEPNIPALRRAFQELVNRHECLRTTFKMGPGGAPVQRVYRRLGVGLQEEDAADWSEDELTQRLAEEAHRPFDLEQGPLLRVILFKRSSHDYALLVALHHIVADLWSLAIIVTELRALYEAECAGVSSGLDPLRFQYNDYVRWQTEMLASYEGERLWQYWEKQLAGELPVLNLPADYSRPPMQTFGGASHRFEVSEADVEAIKVISRDRGATPFMSLLAVFQVLLYRYTGQDDILVGCPTSGRNSAWMADLVGYFVNPVALRAKPLADSSFEEFLDQARHTVVEAFESQSYPFSLLVERLRPQRDPARSALFQVMFVFQKIPLIGGEALAPLALGEAGASIQFGRLPAESVALRQRVAQFDLTLAIAEVKKGLVASLEYNTDLFDTVTVERMTEHFQTLLSSIAANPLQRVSDLPLIPEAERLQMLVDWNNTAAAYYANKCIHELIEQQVEKTPEAIAIIFDESRLSYIELNARANQLGNYLRRLGIGPEVRVGIFVERSIEMVVGLLGVLKAGGAYVPLDPTYPRERLLLTLKDSGVNVLLTHQRLLDRLSDCGARVVCLDADRDEIARCGNERSESGVTPDNLAYIIYTSGSTGRPKGVMITHRNVVNFFAAMDESIGCDPPGLWLAVTSVSFDISVLELLWTIARGFQVVVQPDWETRLAVPQSSAISRGMEFSLFYFASDGNNLADDRYKLLLEGAKFADQHGFSAVWTPERHFHAFGDLYPNPAVTSAAVAAVTRRIKIRAGSVVLPLHSPIRVAEEWSVVDNLSRGRVEISFASGWHTDDFVLSPDNYDNRKEIMFREMETVRKLWRGEGIYFRGGAGNDVEIKIFPRPIQPELPVWITAAGSPDTFRMAGEMGAGLLTHLLGQDIAELAEKIRVYREAWREHGHSQGGGRVALMLHTFVGDDLDEIREKVRKPFCDYLKTSYGLISNLARSLGQDIESEFFTDEDMEALLARAFDRYFQTSGLIGTVSTCGQMIDRLKAIGVDEVACLIDFGVDFDSVMNSLHHLNQLSDQSSRLRGNGVEDHSIITQLRKHGATHLQCTPSMARMLAVDNGWLDSPQSLEKLLLGGEALALSLASEIGNGLKGDIHNMYGPTETTIWSTTGVIKKTPCRISIGRPIANTSVYILDGRAQPQPKNVPGELCIGGDGVARGYLGLSDLTADKFIPNQFGMKSGSRIYKTGDLARFISDGTIEFLDRIDHQVKIRGFRVELGEIESALTGYPAVHEAVVLAQKDSTNDLRLVAYVVPNGAGLPSALQLRDFLREKLPEQMIPSAFVMLDRIPLTPSGKVDRPALFARGPVKPESDQAFAPPRNAVEEVLAAIWADELSLDQVGINDDFFQLGGHSILATRLIARVHETLRVQLPLRTFFQAPTVAGVAAAILENTRQPAEVEKMAELLISVARCPEDQVEAMLHQ